jgi:hypothetical protein
MMLTGVLSAHARTQLYRFARLFVVAFVSTGVLTSNITWSAISGAVVGALEVAWREMYPAVPDPRPTPPSLNHPSTQPPPSP